jgi:phenylpropionate dioxygenase-like ring-hydroxylating dioxygenase large terminal subunit
MLSKADNDLLTRSGPGTPMGGLLRRYWQPAALSAELAAGGAAREVRLLGEDLVAFRNLDGSVGLLGRHCSHRAADLSYGRVEDGGLRCNYHGWLYDVAGNCLDQPAEPADKRFCDKIRHLAYPCREAAGIIWAYLGPEAPPPLPAFDWMLAPEEFVFAFKGYQECNWMQAHEGEIDPSHLSFLHRFFEDTADEDAYGRQILDAAEGTDIPVSRILREQVAPRIEIEATDYGVRIFTVREITEALRHVRITNYLFPNSAVVAVSTDWGLLQVHVPIDDEHNWRYDVMYSFRQPVDRAGLLRDKLELYTLPDYRPRRNRANRYGFDLDEQQAHTYIGIGRDFNTHDTWATEGAGLIQDRTTEHLGSQDKAIIASRRMLLDALKTIEQGGDPPMLGSRSGLDYQDLATIDTVSPADAWQTAWRERHAARVAASAWAARVAV